MRIIYKYIYKIFLKFFLGLVLGNTGLYRKLLGTVRKCSPHLAQHWQGQKARYIPEMKIINSQEDGKTWSKGEPFSPLFDSINTFKILGQLLPAATNHPIILKKVA